MRAFLFALAACAALWAASTSAQTTPTTYVFQTVDAVKLDGQQSTFAVTGILEGEAAPVERIFYYSSNVTGAQLDKLAQCQRMAMQSMARPGYYVLAITASYSYYIPTCKLSRAVP
jgi:hypothetical protein